MKQDNNISTSDQEYLIDKNANRHAHEALRFLSAAMSEDVMYDRVFRNTVHVEYRGMEIWLIATHGKRLHIVKCDSRDLRIGQLELGNYIITRNTARYVALKRAQEESYVDWQAVVPTATDTIDISPLHFCSVKSYNTYTDRVVHILHQLGYNIKIRYLEELEVVSCVDWTLRIDPEQHKQVQTGKRPIRLTTNKFGIYYTAVIMPYIYDCDEYEREMSRRVNNALNALDKWRTPEKSIASEAGV